MNQDSYLKEFLSSSDWRKLQKRFLFINPYCQSCSCEEKKILATAVRHLTPPEKGKNKNQMKKLFFDINNLEGLCNNCYNKNL